MPLAQAESIKSPGEHKMPILSEARCVTLSNDNIVLGQSMNPSNGSHASSQEEIAGTFLYALPRHATMNHPKERRRTAPPRALANHSCTIDVAVDEDRVFLLQEIGPCCHSAKLHSSPSMCSKEMRICSETTLEFAWVPTGGLFT
jgi:hypothetical protein